MKKATRQQIEDSLSYHETQHTLNAIALQYSMRGELDHVVTQRDGEDRYEYRICGADRADGGLVLVTFKHPGQYSDTRAAYLENEYNHARSLVGCSDTCNRHAEALSKCMIRRSELMSQAS